MYPGHKPCSQLRLIRRLRIRRQKQYTAPENHRPHHRKRHLRLPPALHQRRPPTILPHRAHIVREPVDQRRNAQHPEDDPQRQGHAALEARGFAVEVERDDDGQGDDAEVHGETEPGEKGAFVGAVVAGVGSGVFEEEGAEERAGEEDVLGVFEVSFLAQLKFRKDGRFGLTRLP